MEFGSKDGRLVSSTLIHIPIREYLSNAAHLKLDKSKDVNSLFCACFEMAIEGVPVLNKMKLPLTLDSDIFMITVNIA